MFERRVHEQDFGAAMAQNPLEFAGRQASIQHHHDGPELHGRKMRFERHRSVRREHGNAVPRTDAERGEGSGLAGHTVAELAVGEAAIAFHDRYAIAPGVHGSRQKIERRERRDHEQSVYHQRVSGNLPHVKNLRCTSTKASRQPVCRSLQSGWMQPRCWLLFATFWANALQAGAIANLDVSAETVQTVQTGDRLVFHVFTTNFAVNAARFDLPAFPADLNFALVTAPLREGGKFAVTLESGDRSVTAGLGDLTLAPGVLNSNAYSGDVSTLQGYLHVSPLLSASIFESASIAIVLENLGPGIQIGLSPYVLRQDLYVGLSVGRLSVGALPGWVELEEPQNQRNRAVFAVAGAAAARAEVPEPHSGSAVGRGRSAAVPGRCSDAAVFVP